MNQQHNADSKDDLILQLWNECRSDSVGHAELTHIQQALSDTFGIVESPARIARVLADHQVRLRHPQVIGTDAKWREHRIEKGPDPGDLNFESVENALDSVKRLEILRARLLSEGDEASLQVIVEQVREVKIDLARRQTELAEELVQWLAIWLQTPEIFEDWLDLRQNSSEFRQRFYP
jgi:hypothetical protein